MLLRRLVGPLVLHTLPPPEMISWEAATKPETLTEGRTNCYWRVSDADALYREFASVGVPSLTDLSDEPWGMREFTLKDPAGNLIQSVTS